MLAAFRFYFLSFTEQSLVFLNTAFGLIIHDYHDLTLDWAHTKG